MLRELLLLAVIILDHCGHPDSAMALKLFRPTIAAAEVFELHAEHSPSPSL
jgi:hypothetical protein